VSPAEWFDLVERRALSLRAAGVVSISIEGCSVQLAAIASELPPLPASAPIEQEPDDPRANLPGYTFDATSKT
jgi:hypothetical protein